MEEEMQGASSKALTSNNGPPSNSGKFATEDDVCAGIRYLYLEETLGINEGTRATPEVIEVDSEGGTDVQFDQHQVNLLRKFLGCDDGALRELLSICEVNEEEVGKCNLDVTDERIANAMGVPHVSNSIVEPSNLSLSNVEDTFVDVKDLLQSEETHYEISRDPLEGSFQNFSNN